jgi:hypothetical protein
MQYEPNALQTQKCADFELTEVYYKAFVDMSKMKV